jgi:hypothetical protein
MSSISFILSCFSEGNLAILQGSLYVLKKLYTLLPIYFSVGLSFSIDVIIVVGGPSVGNEV